MPTEDIKVLPLVPGPLVVVVDDEATPRASITRWVRALGYQARSCPSGTAALRFLTAHPGQCTGGNISLAGAVPGGQGARPPTATPPRVSFGPTEHRTAAP